MYIPITYFGGVGSLIASGGVESTYITGSVRYKVHEFRGTSGTFNILAGKSNQIDILVVGGGGDNGKTNGTIAQEVYGGGGGAGGYIYSSSIFLQSGSFSVVGGAPRLDITSSGLPGFDSYISSSQLYLLAYGGGGGGSWLGGSSYSDGDTGGSGGGGTGFSSQGSGISGQGFQGGAGTFVSSGGGYYLGGGGGGAASAGSTYTGGQGKINRILNGQTIWYAGGAGGEGPVSNNEGSGSATNPLNTPAGDSQYLVAAGGGGKVNDDTTPGTVIIRYPYQNVELWKCNCVKFEQVGTGLSSGSISYVQGNTGMYIEAEQVEITTPKYRLIVSGSENQVRAFPNLEYSGTPPYLTFSLVDLSFCP